MSVPKTAGCILSEIASRYDQQYPSSQLESERDFTDDNPFVNEAIETAEIETSDDFATFSYNMQHEERGCFLIFNQIEFNPNLKLPLREGTNADFLALEMTARCLGFEYIKTFHNLTKKEILCVIDKISDASHVAYDCFACAILSHGKEGDSLYAKDAEMHLHHFIDSFTKCSTLVGKPKLFFVQACRGGKLDSGSKTQSDGIAFETEESSQPLKSIVIPTLSDFMIAHSTPPGFAAWRNGTHGSWFIQALSQCCQRYGSKLDILQLMTRVNNTVATKFHSSGDGYKQIPSVVSRLRAGVYFTPKKKRSEGEEVMTQTKERR